MKRHIKAVFILAVACSVALSSVAIANVLSEAYSIALWNPYRFEAYINGKVLIYDDYYDRFGRCSQRAIGILNEMESQLRRRYSVCRSGPDCDRLSNDIQTVIELRHNVVNLQSYISERQANRHASFLNSEFGEVSIAIYNLYRRMGVDINKVPEVKRQVDVLSRTPC